MIDDDLIKLEVKDEDGKEVVLYVINIFSDTPYNKEYIVYKISNDESIYASLLSKQGSDYKIEQIISEEELFYVNTRLFEFNSLLEEEYEND